MLLMLLLLFRDGTSEGCLPTPLFLADSILAIVDGAIAALAFFQLLRIHNRHQQLGWTRQKIFHLMIGSSNAGYFIYFVFSLIATCERWRFWLHGCGFFLMACPQILFLAAFLLLLSFWVDLCHQAKDEEEDDENGINESFLAKATKRGSSHLDGRRRCCSFRSMHIGSRQKFVILVMLLTFVLMIAFALLIWSGRGKNSIDSFLVARVYQDISSVAILLLGGALACYGFFLFSKMRKVRSEMVSTESWKVASLAAVTLVCFTTCSSLVLVTNIPVIYHWFSDSSHSIICSVFIFLYYFVGSSVPSGFVLWIMREIPHPVASDTLPESRVVTYIRDTAASTHNPQWRVAVTSSQNKALKASPI